MTKPATAAAPRTATAEIDALIAADAAAAPEVSADALSRITAQAHALREAKRYAAALEQKLADAKAEERRLAEQVLPQLLEEAGLQELTLDTGDRITLEEAVYASIAKEKSAAACAWLEEHNYGSLVKAAFSIAFPKGSITEQARIRALLRTARVPFEEQRFVHPQTLKAFVKESIAAGRELPDTISVHTQPTVNMKLAKEK